MNWETNRNWQIKLLDTRKVTQLNLLGQESVKRLVKSLSVLKNMVSRQ